MGVLMELMVQRMEAAAAAGGALEGAPSGSGGSSSGSGGSGGPKMYLYRWEVARGGQGGEGNDPVEQLLGRHLPAAAPAPAAISPLCIALITPRLGPPAAATTRASCPCWPRWAST